MSLEFDLSQVRPITGKTWSSTSKTGYESGVTSCREYEFAGLRVIQLP